MINLAGQSTGPHQWQLILSTFTNAFKQAGEHELERAQAKGKKLKRDFSARAAFLPLMRESIFNSPCSDSFSSRVDDVWPYQTQMKCIYFFHPESSASTIWWYIWMHKAELTQSDSAFCCCSEQKFMQAREIKIKTNDDEDDERPLNVRRYSAELQEPYFSSQ